LGFWFEIPGRLSRENIFGGKKMKKMFFAGFIVLTLVCLAGCPTEVDSDSTDVNGFISLAEGIEDVDFSFATVRLIRDGVAIGEPVQAAKNGTFTFASVSNAQGYIVVALVESPVINQSYALGGASPGFTVDGGAKNVEVALQELQNQPISGVISGGDGVVGSGNDAAERRDMDLSRTEVQLWRGDDLVRTTNPVRLNGYSEQGNVYSAKYTFEDIPQGFGYKVKAVLVSKRFIGLPVMDWESESFDVLNITSAVEGTKYQVVVFDDKKANLDGTMRDISYYDITGKISMEGGGPA
jgi:hypothetical protein